MKWASSPLSIWYLLAVYGMKLLMGRGLMVEHGQPVSRVASLD